MPGDRSMSDVDNGTSIKVLRTPVTGVRNIFTSM